MVRWDVEGHLQAITSTSTRKKQFLEVARVAFALQKLLVEFKVAAKFSADHPAAPGWATNFVVI